uniref:SHSP domain-containing protein n=1 Tax=Fundulus heteroclitus TaxID=8078 RepID=A0A3Q2PIS9_FUNHE
MLCSHGFPSALSPFMDFSWPVRSLWPEVRPLFYQQDLLQRNLQELRSSLQLMDKLQSQILQSVRVGAFAVLLFLLCLALRVSGKTEKKQEDGKGSYSYRLQQFRQEFDLPEGVKHEDVSCSLSPDGKLHIQAAKVAAVEAADRELTIRRKPQGKSMALQQSLILSKHKATEERKTPH